MVEIYSSEKEYDDDEDFLLCLTSSMNLNYNSDGVDKNYKDPDLRDRDIVMNRIKKDDATRQQPSIKKKYEITSKYPNVMKGSMSLRKAVIEDNTPPFILLLAKMGSGKTDLAMFLALCLSFCNPRLFDIIQKTSSGNNIPENIVYKIRPLSKFYLILSMSSKSLREQLINDFRGLIPEENIFMRGDKKFRTFQQKIINNPEKLDGAVIWFDECHEAAGIKNTNGKLFYDDFGLTLDKIKEQNIKFIFCSATPDPQESLFDTHGIENVNVLKIQPGTNHRGFDFFLRKNDSSGNPIFIDFDEIFARINKDSDEISILVDDIIKRILDFNEPRYHLLREFKRKLIKKGGLPYSDRFLRELIDKSHKSNIRVIEDNCSNVDDENYKNFTKNGEDIPDVHTLFILKGKYTAGNRFRMTKNIGCVIEQAGEYHLTSIQGLQARFHGYYNEEELCTIFNSDREPPRFICPRNIAEDYEKKWNDIESGYKKKPQKAFAHKILCDAQSENERDNGFRWRLFMDFGEVKLFYPQVREPPKGIDGFHIYGTREMLGLNLKPPLDMTLDTRSLEMLSREYNPSLEYILARRRGQIREGDVRAVPLNCETTLENSEGVSETGNYVVMWKI